MKIVKIRKYRVVASLHIDEEESMQYTTYGIQLTDGSGQVLAFCGAVSTDYRRVADFAALCARRRVAAVHIPDIWEDMFG